MVTGLKKHQMDAGASVYPESSLNDDRKGWKIREER